MARSKHEAISSYITDMLALERHIQKAVREQIEDLKNEQPTLVEDLRKLDLTITNHVTSLDRLTDTRGDGGSGIAEAMKKMASSIAGVGAAAIDLVRNERLPKSLRDDFTSFSMAYIGYLMLNTTALAMDDREVAEVAHRHMADYAQACMLLQDLIPSAVVNFLKEERLVVKPDILDEVRRHNRDAWKEPVGATWSTGGHL